MQILTDLKQLNKSVLAIGTFDGLHLGHQDVIKTAGRLAWERHLPLAVLTFHEHPFSLLHPDRVPPCLLDREQKYNLLEKFAVDILIDLHFTADIASINAEDFISLLSNHLVVVGQDFRFGRAAAGRPDMLPDAVIRPLLQVDGHTVSSTCIRQFIGQGKIDIANKLLGRPYAVRGRVEHGQERGRMLGFPTANLRLGKYAVPDFGAYIVAVKPEEPEFAGRNISYYGIANMGNNPTFGNAEPRLEVHILNFHGDLYGKTLEIAFLHQLRKEERFANAEMLQEQLKKDKRNACTYLQNML